MSAGGITFGAAKSVLSLVVDNGTSPEDPRVMARTNEAQFMCLSAIDPTTGGPLVAVGTMATYDIVADGDTITLPPELENAVEVEVLGTGKVRQGTDVRQGWYDLVNQFTYVNPSSVHDNPLVDLFLVPDEDDPTILRRKYQYPGLSHNATVRVTGMKRYRPITSDDDYLIIQNLRALKLGILAMEREENDTQEKAEYYRQKMVESLHAEVKRHLLDPQNTAKRKAAYDADLVAFQQGTKGHSRAMMAHMIPNAMLLGKSEIDRLVDMAELRIVETGALFVGLIEKFDAEVTDGRIFLPARVHSILAAARCGEPVDVRSMFFEYQANGPGFSCGCASMLVDEGEHYFPDTGLTRRMFRLTGGSYETDARLTFVAKLRWTKKLPADPMTVKNLEALRLMVTAVLNEKAEKWGEAKEAAGAAFNVLEKELRDYLAGIKHTVPVQEEGFGFGDLGGPL